MGMNTFRYQGEEREPATYWRRRFVALVIGLAVLAIIAWAFSGALSAGAAARAAGGSRSGRPGGPGAGAAAATGSAASGSASASPPSSAAAVSHGDGPKALPATGSAGPHVTGGVAGRCSRKEVVVSLAPGPGSVEPGELPQFDVDVVSTAGQACRFNVGLKYVALVISSGAARIWSSADCVKGPGSLVTELQRGVPTVLTISWDRERSAPGCAGPAPQVAAGFYTATATVDGALASNSETFRLR